MSTRVTRAEARRRMAAFQEPRPGQGWSETRPTRAPRRALERTRDEDSAPEPAVSSDSDVEVVGGGRSDTARDDGRRRSGTPEGPRRGCLRTTEETRKRFRDREPTDEEQQRTTEEEARWQVRLRQDHEAAAARWHAIGGGGRATIVGGTGGGLVGGSTHPQVRGCGAQSGTEERGWGRALRAISSTVAAGGTGGEADGGADGGAGSTRKPQHAGIRGRGRAVAAADGSVDVARGARDGTDEVGAQDMGRGGPQGEYSGSPDERPAGCVGPADTERGPANTGDDGSEGGGGIAGKRTLGVARATAKTPAAAAEFDARSEALAAAVHAANIGPGGRRLARDR
ncbi:uncharacterized PE-PGRS family protein PE_PGRS54-like [Drosophila subpulchrella]|uniref:uncharacterized PE-PGRS family protein PE_PGRS54-like n=1 Tax=Drosophila subpulchrella TaxID=1486046 RepID=UPI0018A18642|nr:uncharacterized PE-PGRS family protein PE_PGRS54-like [Drosophila subpulchrella]